MNLRLLGVSVAAVGALAVWGVAAEPSGASRPARINLDAVPEAPRSVPKPNPSADATRAQPAPAKKAKAKPNEEPPAKIDGMEISRGEAGFLGLKIDGTSFKMSFYDAKKKPIAPDVSRAILRWSVNYQPNDERTQLDLSPDGKSLSSSKIVRPPHAFKLFITLLKDVGADAQVVGTFVVDFRQ